LKKWWKKRIKRKEKKKIKKKKKKKRQNEKVFLDCHISFFNVQQRITITCLKKKKKLGILH